jgi:WD40 repeat protein
MRLKRHQDAILALHSPDGINGNELVSGSADEKLRIWNMKDRKISKSIPVTRPANEKLIKYKNMENDSLPMFSDMVKQHGGTDDLNAIKNEKLNPL